MRVHLAAVLHTCANGSCLVCLQDTLEKDIRAIVHKVDGKSKPRNPKSQDNSNMNNKSDNKPSNNNTKEIGKSSNKDSQPSSARRSNGATATPNGNGTTATRKGGKNGQNSAVPGPNGVDKVIKDMSEMKLQAAPQVQTEAHRDAGLASNQASNPEADLEQAGVLLRQSYRSMTDSPAAVSNAQEALALCKAAASKFASCGDQLNVRLLLGLL
jgi:hypothetical protein